MSAAGARGGDTSTTGMGTAGATWRTSAEIVAGIVGADVGASHAAHAVDGNLVVTNILSFAVGIDLAFFLCIVLLLFSFFIDYTQRRRWFDGILHLIHLGNRLHRNYWMEGLRPAMARRRTTSRRTRLEYYRYR